MGEHETANSERRRGLPSAEPTPADNEFPRKPAAINYWAVIVAAASTLIASAIYYSAVFGTAWLTMRGIDPSTTTPTPQAWQVAAQFGRNIVVALALATLLQRLRIVTLPQALQLGLLVWVGFQAMAIVGSVLHEQYPLGLYALHVGDAFLTTLIMTLVLAVWRRRPEA